MSQSISRREFLRYAGLTAAGAALAACGGASTAPTAAPTAAPAAGNAAAAQATSAPTAAAGSALSKKFPGGTKIQFWSMAYGDTAQYTELLNKLAAEFKAETNIEVESQIQPWANAAQLWLLVDQGGAHPDVADMYWLYSNAAIGGGKYGPMPMDQYKDMLWPNLKDRYIEATLKDGEWQGKFYGIPWRGDIRPFMYRTDYLQEAGFTKPPDTWDEVVEYAKKLTVRDKSGTVTRWGFTLSDALPVQQMMQWLWQAGGEYMTSDGVKATVDTPEMRTALKWMYDLIWTHQVMSPELMEKSYNVMEMFQAGKIAMVGSTGVSAIRGLDKDFPQLNGKWAISIPTMGPKNRSSYLGAGYFGTLYGTQQPEASARWMEFLTRDDVQQRMIEFSGYVPTNKKVAASPFWTDKEWKKVVIKTMEYAHPSQHPSPAWQKLTATEPGGVLYDLYYSVLVKKEPIDETLKTAQKRMQEEMDKVKPGAAK